VFLNSGAVQVVKSVWETVQSTVLRKEYRAWNFGLYITSAVGRVMFLILSHCIENDNK
jgi:hypothetical protein